MILFAGPNYKDWKVFVQNRVTQIRKLTSTWKYVSSEDNPADCPTRGMTFEALRDCKKWWFCTMWLSQGKETWPGQPESLRESDPECLCEMKAESCKQVKSDVHESSTYSAVATELHNVELVVEYERYNSFGRIIRITAWVQ